MKLQLLNLGQRNAYHPHVNADTDGTVDPSEQVDIEAPSILRLNILHPIKAYWRALKYRNEDKRDTEGDGNGHSGPEQKPCRLAWEYGEVEEQQADLDAGHEEQIENLLDEKVTCEFRNHGWLEGPDVLA
jgi:hypothetical protein